MPYFSKILELRLLTTLISTISAIAETIKAAFIDPLSGPFATSGTNGLVKYEFAAAELINKQDSILDGKYFEITSADNKMGEKAQLIQLQTAIDQGIKFIAQVIRYYLCSYRIS